MRYEDVVNHSRFPHLDNFPLQASAARWLPVDYICHILGSVRVATLALAEFPLFDPFEGMITRLRGR